MRIGIDARESGTSTGRYIDKLVEHLHQLNPSYKVVVLTKSHRLDYIKQVAPNFEVVKSDIKEFTFAEQLKLAWQLYRLKLDLVHFNAPQQPVLYFKKSITTIHDLTTVRFNNPSKNWMVYKIKQFVYKLVIHWVGHRAKALLTPSEFVRRDLENFAKSTNGKVAVTYEAAEKINDQPEVYDKLKGKRYIMYVGRPLPHKNLKRLVRAYKKLAAKHSDLQLVLVGKHDWHFQQLERYVAQSKVDGVVFTDFVPDAQLRWLYEQASAYVFPSLSEGFGLPALEAMNYGAPVVSSYATCLPEIYKNAAEYFNPLDIDDMTAAISRVLESPELSKKLSANGQKLVKAYSWNNCAKQTLEVYKQILDT